MDAWRLIAERKIREAMEDGAFDRLDSAGKPLDLGDHLFADPSGWMAHRVLKNNGLAPPWIEEGREIEAERKRLRSPDSMPRSEYDARAADLNRRIRDFNLTAPPGLEKLPFVPRR
jgi:hypothetical protein